MLQYSDLENYVKWIIKKLNVLPDYHVHKYNERYYAMFVLCGSENNYM